MKTKTIPQVFRFDGKHLVELKHSNVSGLWTFKDIEDGEIYRYERCEIPDYIFNKMKRETL